jgi:multidrug transporter EmrE-like cation transporter
MKQALKHIAIAAFSFVMVTFLESLSTAMQGRLPLTEIYSVHSFSHVFFGVGLASIILFLRPKSTARVVILGVLFAGIVWELHEGFWLKGEPIDSLEDIVLAVLSASALLYFERGKGSEPDST